MSKDLLDGKRYAKHMPHSQTAVTDTGGDIGLTANAQCIPQIEVDTVIEAGGDTGLTANAQCIPQMQVDTVIEAGSDTGLTANAQCSPQIEVETMTEAGDNTGLTANTQCIPQIQVETVDIEHIGTEHTQSNNPAKHICIHILNEFAKNQPVSRNDMKQKNRKAAYDDENITEESSFSHKLPYKSCKKARYPWQVKTSGKGSISSTCSSSEESTSQGISQSGNSQKRQFPKDGENEYDKPKKKLCVITQSSNLGAKQDSVATLESENKLECRMSENIGSISAMKQLQCHSLPTHASLENTNQCKIDDVNDDAKSRKANDEYQKNLQSSTSAKSCHKENANDSSSATEISMRISGGTSVSATGDISAGSAGRSSASPMVGTAVGPAGGSSAGPAGGLSTGPAGVHHLTFIQKWQNQHLAKAIVDNAINKTLGELGLSPNPHVNRLADQQRLIENEGVSAAIKSRGLRRQAADHVRNDDDDRMRRLSPIILRLTQVSENIFAQNMYLSLCPSSSRTGLVSARTSNPTPPIPQALTNSTAPERILSENLLQSQPISIEENLGDMEPADNTHMPPRSLVLTSVQQTGANNKEDSLNMNVKQSQSTSTSDDINVLMSNSKDDKRKENLDLLNITVPSTKDIMDEALNAAISEKGLFFGQ